MAILALFVAQGLPDSAVADGVRYVVAGYISIDLLLRARAGYLRRRPHWTPESWRRYLITCSIPTGALLIMVSLIAALEWRLPIVGAARSTTRGVWAAGAMVFMIVGAGGLVVAVEWLATGETSQQFAAPRWLTRARRQPTAAGRA